MNIYHALQHVFIGYGINRKIWKKLHRTDPNRDMVLYYDHNEHCLRVLGSGSPASQDSKYNMMPSDWDATDWEAV